MKSKIFLSAVACALMSVPMFTSCEDWLEEKAYTFVTTDDIPNSNEGADSWTLGVYNSLFSDMFMYGSFPRPLDYDCDYISGAVWQFSEFGSGNFQGGTSQADAMWNGMYALINKANKAITNVKALDGATERHRDNCLGELYFLKAWAYFMLTRAYGDIPIHSVSVDEEGTYDNFPRIPIKEVYEKTIIPLLDDARTMLYKNTEGAYTPGRVNAASAAGLEAKVYATMAAGATAEGEDIVVKTGIPYVVQNINGTATKVYTDPVKTLMHKSVVAGYENFDARDCWQKAYDLAKAVKKGDYGKIELSSYADLWSNSGKTASEHLFSLQTISGDNMYGTLFSYHYCGMTDAAGHIVNSLTVGMRWHWYMLFEEMDHRIYEGVLHAWIREGSDTSWGGGSYFPNFGIWQKKVENREAPYDNTDVTSSWRCDGAGSEQFFAFQTKYLQQISDRSLSRTDANYPFLRYADVLLILAEAANELNGPTQEAVSALNQVRERSNATPRDIEQFEEGTTVNVDGVNTKVSPKASLRSSIIEERAMELALEGDRRWDLIRWGIYLPAMNALGGADEPGNVKERSEKHLLFPIPTLEVLTNKGITANNPGWN